MERLNFTLINRQFQIFLHKNEVVGAHYKHFLEALMMSTHNLEDFMEVDKNDPPIIAKYPTLICLLVG